MFTPEQDEEILRMAGFETVELFFAAFTWRAAAGCGTNNIAALTARLGTT